MDYRKGLCAMGWVLLLGISLLMMPRAYAWQLHSYPLPLKLEKDEQVIASSFGITVKILEGKKDYQKLGEQPQDSSDYMVYRLVQSFKEKDGAAYKATCNTADTDEAFAFQAKLYAMAEQISFVRKMKAGDALFYSMALEGGGFFEPCHLPVLLSKQGGAYVNSIDLMGNPLIENIVSMDAYRAKDAAHFTEIAPCSGVQKFTPSDPALGLNSGANEVSVFFKGVIPTWGTEVYSNEEFVTATPPAAPTAVDQVIATYRDAYESLFNTTEAQFQEMLSDLKAGFLGFCSTESAKNVQEMLNQLDYADAFEMYKHQVTPKQICYVIDAEPVYFVFSSRFANAADDDLNYVMMHKENENKYVITNVGYLTNVDALLTWDKFQDWLKTSVLGL